MFSTGFLNGLYIVPILAVLIIVHEIGHFWAARRVGVRVEEFGIGIPPRIFGWTRNGVIWSVNMIPFGGFVRVKGEESGMPTVTIELDRPAPKDGTPILMTSSQPNVISVPEKVFVDRGRRCITIPLECEDVPSKTTVRLTAQIPGSSSDKIFTVDVVVYSRDLSARDKGIQAELGQTTEVSASFCATLPVPAEEDSVQPAISAIAASRRAITGGGGNFEPDSMNAKSPGRRAFFLSAGVIMNLITAIVLMIIVVGFRGIPHERVYLNAVVPGSPAAKAGWLAGDRLVSADGSDIDSTTEMVNITSSNAGSEMEVVIERRGKLISTLVTPRENPPKGQGRIGISMSSSYAGTVVIDVLTPGSPSEAAGLQIGDTFVTINGREATDFTVMETELTRYAGRSIPVTVQRGGETIALDLAVPDLPFGGDPFALVGLAQITQTPTFEKVPLLQIIPRGFAESFSATKEMLRSMREMFSSRENLANVAGPIGMGQMTSELVSASPLPLWVVIANISIVLSLNLAILNLLPIPALDGARLLFVLIEVLRGGKRVSPQREGLVHMTGFVILIGLMLFIGYRDIARLIGGSSFIP